MNDVGDILTKESRPSELLVVLSLPDQDDNTYLCMCFFWRGPEMHWRTGLQDQGIIDGYHKIGNLANLAPHMPAR